jgi:hypothetical protein
MFRKRKERKLHNKMILESFEKEKTIFNLIFKNAELGKHYNFLGVDVTVSDIEQPSLQYGYFDTKRLMEVSPGFVRVMWMDNEQHLQYQNVPVKHSHLLT